jgi:phosphohistidine phosphatase
MVVVSTARRAQLTWGLAATRLSARWSSVRVEDEARIYEAPPSALAEVARERAVDAETVVLVGHNPGLAGLVLALAQPSALRDEATAKFPTSAVCVLSADEPLEAALVGERRFSVSAFAVPRG